MILVQALKRPNTVTDLWFGSVGHVSEMRLKSKVTKEKNMVNWNPPTAFALWGRRPVTHLDTLLVCRGQTEGSAFKKHHTQQASKPLRKQVFHSDWLGHL